MTVLFPEGESTLVIKHPCQKQAIIYLYGDKKKNFQSFNSKFCISLKFKVC